MNQNRLIFIFTSVLLFLSACTQTGSSAAEPAPAATPAAAATFPLTMTDDLDREVTITSRPERIVSLLPSNTEILFAVGAGEQVVGVTSYCNYPPETATRTQVGGITSQTISIEAVAALEPDLVVASGAQKDVIQPLSEAGLTVIALQPATFEDIYSNITMVGQVTGHADQAAAVVEDMRDRVAAVSAQVATIPEAERPTVYYEVWNEPLMTAGPHTFIGQMIDLAGGRQIFADAGEDWPQVSAEVIINRNPAIILGPTTSSEILTAEKIGARPGWENIAAVRDNHIYLLDPDIVSRPGPRIVEALEAMAQVFYPDRFP